MTICDSGKRTGKTWKDMERQWKDNGAQLLPVLRRRGSLPPLLDFPHATTPRRVLSRPIPLRSFEIL